MFMTWLHQRIQTPNTEKDERDDEIFSAAAATATAHRRCYRSISHILYDYDYYFMKI